MVLNLVLLGKHLASEKTNPSRGNLNGEELIKDRENDPQLEEHIRYCLSLTTYQKNRGSSHFKQTLNLFSYRL